MLEAVLLHLPEASIVIKTAAVADYTVSNPAEEKLKRSGRMTLDLEPTTDILAEVARRRTSQIVIGFAAETQNVIENAKKKLAAKSLDAIVVNDVSRPGIGFDSERNTVTILTASDTTNVPENTKWEVAQRVLDQAIKLKQGSALASHSVPS
jgi:phosphopantothenoylcysteine decarboxylase/phosphopantothenate--cysteine ligase